MSKRFEGFFHAVGIYSSCVEIKPERAGTRGSSALPAAARSTETWAADLLEKHEQKSFGIRERAFTFQADDQENQ